MNIILFGPPGAGKGTQAKNIVKKYNYFQLSTGDLLRNEINNNTEIGKKISKIIGEGNFVTDEIVEDLIFKIASNTKYKNKIIFDGYPRNLNQAKSLDKLLYKQNQKINKIIFLDVSRDEIIRRASGRVLCDKCNEILNEFTNKKELDNHKCGKQFLKKRPDDNIQIITKRYDEYIKQTEPVLDYYKSNHNFHQIDGTFKVDEITSKIEDIFKV